MFVVNFLKPLLLELAFAGRRHHISGGPVGSMGGLLHPSQGNSPTNTGWTGNVRLPYLPHH